ncbi:MAG: hypothetical protein WC341_04445 [Bacteroidales bacterium]|jgi:hypothetical protein
MIANVTYNDFIGTVATDISDRLGRAGVDNIKGIAKFFHLDEERFKPVGISLYEIDGFHISLLCVDKEKSTEEKEHIVSMSCEVDNEKEIIDILFKHLSIVLYDKFDNKYPELDYDEEVRYRDFHKTEEE